MRSAYSCHVSYWHVQFCAVLWMPASTLYADSISRSLHFDIMPSFLRPRVMALLVFWWSHFLEANQFGNHSQLYLPSLPVCRAPSSSNMWGICFIKETFKTTLFLYLFPLHIYLLRRQHSLIPKYTYFPVCTMLCLALLLIRKGSPMERHTPNPVVIFHITLYLKIHEVLQKSAT